MEAALWSLGVTLANVTAGPAKSSRPGMTAIKRNSCNVTVSCVMPELPVNVTIYMKAVALQDTRHYKAYEYSPGSYGVVERELLPASP